MSEKTDNFIKTVGILARNEYLARDKWVLPSLCIAQAALESGWNLNTSTLFGIKSDGTGDSFTAKTTEYCKGHYEEIQATFKNYPSIAASVKGYFNLITGLKRYAGAVCNTDYKDSIQKIWEGGYATDPNYVGKILSIIEGYGLMKYDSRNAEGSGSTSAASDATSSGGDTCTVQPGDTLWGIAEKFLGNGASYTELAKLNGIDWPDVIYAGQVLKLTASGTASEAQKDNIYMVKSGDTLWEIAERLYGNGARYHELADKNGIKNPNLIYSGKEKGVEKQKVAHQQHQPDSPE